MTKPIIIREQDAPGDGWDDDVHGTVTWRTLLSADATPSEALTAGVAMIAPGQELRQHRHTPPEIYYILAGTGLVTINGEPYEVGPQTAVFIPGDALHGIRNIGVEPLRFLYAFAVDSFASVEYRF
jgi:mannose-6-phosphate isomerase-like protein (cupin superfamily)